MNIEKGATRCAFLVGRWAIKIPRTASWSTFLTGLLANMQEREFARTKWPELCPVAWSMPGGWIVVMPRARPLTTLEWCCLDLHTWPGHTRYVLPVEMKQDSFGVLDDQVVAVDYGS
jgi:hypothetical protein